MGTVVGMTNTDPIARIKANAAAVKAAAASIDASRTEAIAPTDLKVGDVITQIDAHVFPFPFTLSRAHVITLPTGACTVQVAATHGWFAHLNRKNVVRRVVA